MKKKCGATVYFRFSDCTLYAFCHLEEYHAGDHAVPIDPAKKWMDLRELVTASGIAVDATQDAL